jgi:hypothetical protein
MWSCWVNDPASTPTELPCLASVTCYLQHKTHQRDEHIGERKSKASSGDGGQCRERERERCEKGEIFSAGIFTNM